jgi:integrase
LLSGILSFAVSEGIIVSNPVFGVKRPADQRRTARLTPETYKRPGDALRVLEADGANPFAIAAVRLLSLTGCRRGEIERLQWAEVDAAAHALRFQDTKEGASVRPIGQSALDVIAALPRRQGCAFVPLGVERRHRLAGCLVFGNGPLRGRSWPA